MPDPARVSVVIAACDHERFVGEAIDGAVASSFAPACAREADLAGVSAQLDARERDLQTTRSTLTWRLHARLTRLPRGRA